jgi:hypothetical protein
MPLCGGTLHREAVGSPDFINGASLSDSFPIDLAEQLAVNKHCDQNVPKKFHVLIHADTGIYK